jgi:hypothetical protein
MCLDSIMILFCDKLLPLISKSFTDLHELYPIQSIIALLRRMLLLFELQNVGINLLPKYFMKLFTQ